MTYVPNGSYVVEATLASAVADDATFTTGYPTGTTTESFSNGNYKAGSGKVIINDLDSWADADPGIEVTTFGASTITFTNRTGATLAAGSKVRVGLLTWQGPPRDIIVPFASMVTLANGDLVTDLVPGIAGYITHVEWVQGKAVTTASKLATINVEIGTTDLTGGVVSLTSALCTPLGKVIAGTRVTAANRIERNSKVSVEATSVTAFAEGDGYLRIKIQPDVL